jgi:hypothetical protein
MKKVLYARNFVSIHTAFQQRRDRPFQNETRSPGGKRAIAGYLDYCQEEGISPLVDKVEESIRKFLTFVAIIKALLIVLPTLVAIVATLVTNIATLVAIVAALVAIVARLVNKIATVVMLVEVLATQLTSYSVKRLPEAL